MFWVGLILGCILAFGPAILVVAFCNMRRRSDINQLNMELRQWAEAAYSILLLGEELMPVHLLSRWTGLDCVIDSYPYSPEIEG